MARVFANSMFTLVVCCSLSACTGAGSSDHHQAAGSAATPIAATPTAAEPMEECCLKQIADGLVGQSFRRQLATGSTTVRFQPKGVLDVTNEQTGGQAVQNTGKWEITPTGGIVLHLDAAQKATQSVKLEEGRLMEIVQESKPDSGRGAPVTYIVVQ